MTDAERLFNETFKRWLLVGSIVTNFRTTFTEVAHSARRQLELKNIELMRMLFEDPLFEGILVDTEPQTKARKAAANDYEKLGVTAAKGVFESSYASLDAAVVVFYHSLLDALVFDCCRVSALRAPQDWEQDLKDARVALFEMKNHSFEEIRQTKLNEHLQRLEKDSLLTKIDRVLARCTPPHGWSPMEDYKYDRVRIQAFDDQRHRIVHGQALGHPLGRFELSEKNLNYVQQTGMFFVGLLNFRYDLRIDPNYWTHSTR
jgi:hypothetical protein